MSYLIFDVQLQALMDQHALTQEFIAKIAGVTQGAVSGWLKGSIPRADALLRLSRYFDLPMDTLLTGRVLATNEVQEIVRPTRVTPELLRLAGQAAESAVALQDALRKMS